MQSHQVMTVLFVCISVDVFIIQFLLDVLSLGVFCESSSMDGCVADPLCRCFLSLLLLLSSCSRHLGVPFSQLVAGLCSHNFIAVFITPFFLVLSKYVHLSVSQLLNIIGAVGERGWEEDGEGRMTGRVKSIQGKKYNK